MPTYTVTITGFPAGPITVYADGSTRIAVGEGKIVNVLPETQSLASQTQGIQLASGRGLQLAVDSGGAGPPPVLGDLTGTFTLQEDAASGAVAGNISGRTVGSTLTLIDNAGGRVSLVSGPAIARGATALDYETATSHSFTVRETLSGATNTPKDTVFTLNVTNVPEQPSLSALTLSANSIPEDGAATINILGATAGSTITTTGTLPSGMSVNSGARTITGTPPTPGTYNFNLVETLADSPNSPRSSAVTITVTAVATTTLSALTGTFSLTENDAANTVAGAIGGKTAGSTLSLFDDAGARVALSGTNIVKGATSLDYETATSHSFTLRETLAGATNSPRDTVLTLSVTNIFEVTLVTLSGTFTLPENAAANAVAGAIVGKTAGSTLTLADDSNGRVALSGSNVVRGATSLNFEGATSHKFTVRESHSDGTNSPSDTELTLLVTNIYEQPSLSALTLDDTTIDEDASVTINIVGATAGSTITGTVPSGLTLNSGARTITGIVATPGTYNFDLIETLNDSANSPRTSSVSITVATVGGGPLPYSGTITDKASAGGADVVAGPTASISRAANETLVAFVVSRNSTGATATSISDSLGASWVKIGDYQGPQTNPFMVIGIFYLPKGAADSRTVSAAATATGSQPSTGVSVIGLTDLDETALSNFVGQASATTPNTTTLTGNAILTAHTRQTSSSITVPTGYTAISASKGFNAIYVRAAYDLTSPGNQNWGTGNNNITFAIELFGVTP